MIFKLKKTPIMMIAGEKFLEEGNIPPIGIIGVLSIKYFHGETSLIAEILYKGEEGKEGNLVQYIWSPHQKSWKFLKDVRYYEYLQAKKAATASSRGTGTIGKI